jgi:hypothetical protein
LVNIVYYFNHLYDILLIILFNIIDVIAYFLPTYTSIYWYQTNDKNIQLISFTCLFLNLKYLLFFRVFEFFGIFFVIIFAVGEQLLALLWIVFIITICFAHAFYILLSPEDNFSFKEPTNNNDSNNPWNLTPSYHQVFENGTINPNPFIIQQPDGNTNMFVNFNSALFAMYKFLTGI